MPSGRHSQLGRSAFRDLGPRRPCIAWRFQVSGSGRGETVSLPQTTGGYGLGPGEGEGLWFNGGLGLLKATAMQTDGRFAAMELLAPKGFASPLHIHRDEDEF